MVTQPGIDKEEPVAKRVLLVEDETLTRNLLGSLLEELGAVVELATNGTEAIEALQAKTYDLVVLDILLPEMDGLEVLAWMKERGNETPVASISHVQQSSKLNYAEIAKTLGAKKSFLKPIKRAQLEEALDLTEKKDTDGG
jgi:CheY-like chemotaxis protein